MSSGGYRSDYELKKYILYLTLSGKPKSVFCEYLVENWLIMRFTCNMQFRACTHASLIMMIYPINSIYMAANLFSLTVVSNLLFLFHTFSYKVEH